MRWGLEPASLCQTMCVTPEAHRKPGYREIADSLRAQIASGDLTAGEMLPTLPELQETWGVARKTARRAVKVLEGEGLVAARGGRRTTVNPALEGPCPDWIAAMWGVEPGALVRAQRINGHVILRRVLP